MWFLITHVTATKVFSVIFQINVLQKLIFPVIFGKFKPLDYREFWQEKKIMEIFFVTSFYSEFFICKNILFLFRFRGNIESAYLTLNILFFCFFLNLTYSNNTLINFFDMHIAKGFAAFLVDQLIIMYILFAKQFLKLK